MTTQKHDEELVIVDPVEAISGVLKHVKKTSVELQHEISQRRGERYFRHRR